MQGLYPIIRRMRRPLLTPEAVVVPAPPPAVPLVAPETTVSSEKSDAAALKGKDATASPEKRSR